MASDEEAYEWYEEKLADELSRLVAEIDYKFSHELSEMCIELSDGDGHTPRPDFSIRRALRMRKFLDQLKDKYHRKPQP